MSTIPNGTFIRVLVGTQREGTLGMKLEEDILLLHIDERYPIREEATVVVVPPSDIGPSHRQMLKQRREEYHIDTSRLPN